MAKKHKGRKSKKEIKREKNSGFWRSIGAITLIIAGLILLFGAFIDAPIPQNFWNGVWWAFGAAAIVAPIALVFLGIKKFITEDQRIPMQNLVGAVGLLVFLASFLHAVFVHTDAATGTTAGGHGGTVGEAVGNVLINSLGQVLAIIIFFLLSVFAAIFMFALEPKAVFCQVTQYVQTRKS